MATIPELFEVQAGKEVTWGTSVTPTVKLMGISDATIKPIVESELIDEKRGTLAPGYTSVINKVSGEASVEGVVLYEDIPYWLDSLFGLATPSGANPYVYAYSSPVGSAPTTRKMTLASGDGTNEYSLAGAVVKALSISGESNSKLEFSAELIGKQVSSDALASLDDRSVTVAMGNHVALYIDAFGGTIGSTQVNATAFSFELEIETNRELVFHMGSATPTTYREGKWEGTLKLSLELNATSKAYLDSIIGATAVFKKLVRIKATSGTNILQFDFAGFAENAPELWTDEDGVTTVELELKGLVDSDGLEDWLEASVTNSVSALA